MKIFKLMMVALVVMCGLNSCSDDCDHDVIDVDYSKSIVGVWSSESESYEEGIRFYDDGKFIAFGNKGEGDFYVDGTWTLQQNRLLLTTNEGETHFSGIIEVYAEDVMLMTSDGSKNTYVYHYFVDSPFPKSLVGTWTCLEGNFAEALTIHEDGSLVSTRLEGGNYWEGMEGTFMEEEGTYGIELNGDYTFGTYEVVSGELLAFIDTKTNKRRTYHYCKEDLSEEMVGMWILQDQETELSVQNYHEDGSMENVGYFYIEGIRYDVSESGTYKVIGDLLFTSYLMEDGTDVVATRIDYTPEALPLGDVLVSTRFLYAEGFGTWEIVYTWLRVKQELNLAGKSYDYNKTFVTHAKGEDKDIPFLDTSFNFAKMDGSIIDKFLKSTLFSVEFPDANTLKYSFLVGGQNTSRTAPIAVEGNKMTIKMSENNPVFHDIEVYTFQDQNNTQMHLYMPTASFEKFFANTSVHVMLGNGQLDENDTEAIAGVYKSVADAVESIDLALVMHSSK